MAIVVIPWVAGAAIGSVATYLYKDKHIREEVSRTAGNVTDQVIGAANTVTEKVSAGIADLRDRLFGKPVEEIAPAAPKKTTKRKRATAQKAAKRTVAKRTAASKKTTRKPRAAKKPTAAAA